MEISELKGKTKDQLIDMVVSMKKELFNLRFQSAAGQVEDISRFGKIRKDIARVKTVMTQQKKEQKKA